MRVKESAPRGQGSRKRRQQSSAVLRLCLLGFGAALNAAGAGLTLLLHLPLYFDTLGTVLAAALFGPFWGMLPGLAGGLLSGCLGDVYAFYYLPVQLVTGLAAGLLFRLPGAGLSRPLPRRPLRLLAMAAALSLPGTLMSASITAFLFGGVTSSGSSVLVQLLHRAGLGLTQSVCAVQAVTDYLDRAAVLAAAGALLAALPASFWNMLKQGGKRCGTL